MTNVKMTYDASGFRLGINELEVEYSCLDRIVPLMKLFGALVVPKKVELYTNRGRNERRTF